MEPLKPALLALAALSALAGAGAAQAATSMQPHIDAQRWGNINKHQQNAAKNRKAPRIADKDIPPPPPHWRGDRDQGWKSHVRICMREKGYNPKTDLYEVRPGVKQRCPTIRERSQRR